MENTCSWSSSGEAWPSPSNPGCLTGVPEELLEDYINLALNLSGSAFRVELAAETATVQEADRVRSRARSSPGAHRARSVPGAHRVRSRARSFPHVLILLSRDVPGSTYIVELGTTF